MFMALRQEDRHAVTEILSQTPDIPDTCQWALFLRNHDELTLEMVTDEERDYMYQVYAADPQMRINLGIRRRLAPLVENSRRRVELLNILLFSLPGTPIVYYGDEVGMGDNIYLGDRNGVRTPMQWSSDRNGGFSRADPARLFAPPIMDPVYGYQAINVEAQERYPFSLLNWMKRLIGMRRQHRVFGRGSLEFVGCANRKVLAYLRRDAHETILVVANLSRSLQPAELDLKSVAGLIPVEMFGQSEFPRVTEQPYFLTLGPYAAYYMTLQQSPMQVTPRVSTPPDPDVALAESLPALLVGVDWQTLLDGAARTVLERRALAPFLQRQRWFASKSREIRTVEFSDWTTVRSGQEPAFLAIISVLYTDGWTDSYVVPMALLSGAAADQAVRSSPSTVIARITGARKGAIVDGMLDNDVCERLLDTAIREGRLATMKGGVRGTSAGAGVDLPSEHVWTRVAGDQSNTLAFVNDRYVLKVFRRIEPGINPELDIARYLTSKHFRHTPTLVGALEYDRPAHESGTLGLVETAAQHQGTAWQFSIDELSRYYERVAAREAGAREQADVNTGSEPTPFFKALESWYLTSATTLGRRTAELHIALADSTDPAFAPEPTRRDDLVALAEMFRENARTSLDLLQTNEPLLPESTRALAAQVLASRTALVERSGAIEGLANAGARIRIHGDYHLGQVLKAEEDFVILDFEGEPARSLAERKSKHSPLKDVAGMMRSFSYAAYAALFAFCLNAPDEFATLEPWADTWRHWAGRAFLTGYRDVMAGYGAAILPDDAGVRTLLRAYMLEKAFYEMRYELNSRPDWVRIPLAGILHLR